MSGFRHSLWLFVWPALVSAQFDPDELFGPRPKTIPIVGRPQHFSGGSGSFTVEASVSPKRVQVGEAILLKLTVRAMGKVDVPPTSFPLDGVAELSRLFSVEEQKSTASKGRVWTFEYTLKPRRGGTLEVPSLPFRFHDPRIPIAERSFQTRYTEPISVEVVVPEAVKVPLRVPKRFFELAPSPGVLRLEHEWSLPTPLVWLTLATLPPLASLGWCLLWRWWYPDHARQMRQRRSRAASLAIRQLARTNHLDDHTTAALVAKTLTDYLHQRIAMPPAEATPREAAYYLRQVGCSIALADRAKWLYETCDRARFLPESEASVSLSEEATTFVLAVEAET